MGFCEHCYFMNGRGCNSCIQDPWYGLHPSNCTCKNNYRYGDKLSRLDPRLNPDCSFVSSQARPSFGFFLKLHLTFIQNTRRNGQRLSLWDTVIWVWASSCAPVPRQTYLNDPSRSIIPGKQLASQWTWRVQQSILCLHSSCSVHWHCRTIWWYFFRGHFLLDERYGGSLDRSSFMDQLTAFLAYTNLAMPKIFHKILLCMSLSTHYPKFNISLGLGWFDDASRIVQITTQKSGYCWYHWSLSLYSTDLQVFNRGT